MWADSIPKTPDHDQHDDYAVTMIPHANFRWVWRKPNAPSFVGQEKVLQQAFSRPDRQGFIWRDVPVTEEAT